jgi:succinate dehydrogenase assembly factor 1
MSGARSGLQIEVLRLYRSFLRAAQKKSPETAAQVTAHVKSEFRKFAKSIHRFDTTNVEYRLRLGQRQLERMQNTSMEGFKVFTPPS